MEDQKAYIAEEPSASLSSRPTDVVYGDVEIDLRRAFRRAFPWLRLVQALRLSFGFGKLALAILGVLLLELAWSGLEWGLADAPAAAGNGPFLATIRRNLEAHPRFLPFVAAGSPTRGISSLVPAEPISVFLTPLNALLADNPLSWNGLHAGAHLLTTILVWGVFGCAVARIAIVQAGSGRGLSARRSLRYALKHLAPAVVTPLLPILMIMLAALACRTFGLIFRIPAVGRDLGGMLLFVPLGLGILMFTMVAGLTGGWPLMIASTAAEGEDSLDALSRSFSYLNHRLGSYLFYIAVAIVIGIPGWLLINWAVEGVLGMTLWGLRPVAAVESIFFPSPSAIGSDSGSTWVGLIRMVPRAWAYSYFWTAIALIYLLIRKDVDGAEWSQLKPDES